MDIFAYGTFKKSLYQSPHFYHPLEDFLCTGKETKALERLVLII